MNYRQILALILLFVQLLPASVSAQYQPYLTEREITESHDQAATAMQQGNYAIAYCLWQPLAKHGDREAQFNIGWMYHNGYGLSINDEQALYWWLKAAANGSIDAHFALGDLYANGQGVERNMPIAIGWYIAAARRDHETARETLMALLSEDNELAQVTFKQLLQSEWGVLGESQQVNVERANTRRGPDKSYPIVTTLSKGHEVIPLKTENNWTYIGITGSGKIAWIFNSLISKAPGAYSLQSIE